MLFKGHNPLRPLRVVIPHMQWDLFKRSMLRYSGKKYRLNSRSMSLDILSSSMKYPFVAAYLMVRSKFMVRRNEASEVLFECGDAKYYRDNFSKMEGLLSGIECKRSGTGAEMHYPPISNVFSMGNSLYAAMMLMIMFPYVLLLSMLYRKNFIWALARNALVYYRTLNYFKTYPCRVFLTYADNKCSPAFYSAFKNAGGLALCAFQNGIRFADEGIDHSFFDHFFPIGRATVDIYKKADSLIGGFTEVGSLVLNKHVQSCDFKTKNEYDVLFIDQGYPVSGKTYWGFVGAEDIETFLEYIKRFASEKRHLRLVYQLRNYDAVTCEQKEGLKKWFEDTHVILQDGSNGAYDSIVASSVVVTACSTLGLTSLAMGKPTLFFNFNGNNIYDVISGPLQSSGRRYSDFADRIESALQGKIGVNDVDVDKYISKNSFEAAYLIAEQIKKELGITCH